MLELLSLRLRAGGRAALCLLRHDTLPAVLVLLVFVVGAVLLLGAVQAEGAARQLAAASVVLLSLIHFSRRDARFLALAGRVPALVFAVEYLALLLPVAILLATGAARWLAPAVLLGGVLIAWMPSGPLADMHARLLDRKSTFSPAPALDFEWISGLRELLLPLALLYLVAIPLSVMPVGLIALVVLLTWGACYFYSEGEGWLLIQAFGLPPGAFLRVKTGRALRLWALLTTPLAILFLVRHLSLWPVLPMENHFYSRITGREYLRVFQARAPAFDADAWAGILELPLDRFVDAYSAGMKKKLALVGTLSLGRPVVLLDEPMNGLDLESNLLLGRLLRELAEAGCVVVVTSHVLPSLTAACDRVHVLEGGQISLSATRERFSELEGRLVTLESEAKMARMRGLVARGRDG